MIMNGYIIVPVNIYNMLHAAAKDGVFPHLRGGEIQELTNYSDAVLSQQEALTERLLKSIQPDESDPEE